MSLLHQFDESLLNRAEKQALEFLRPDGSGVATSTFGELEQRSNQFASLLAERGLKPGDRLAFFLQNRPEVIELWLAAVKMGVILVPVNVLYRERELRHILMDSAPTAVVTSRDLVGHIPDGLPIWDVDELAEESRRHTTERQQSCATPFDDNTPLALIYTSGTTGA